MTDWEQHYLDDHTPWDKGEASPPLIDWLDANPGRILGRLLSPGCGLGYDLRAIATICPEAELIGLEISPTAIDRAREFPVIGGERYELGDLFDLPPDWIGAFDWIWEHTCFCAITPEMREDYVKAVASALKPGGQFLGVFYLNPYDDEHAPGEGPPHGCSPEELEQRFVDEGPFEIVERYVPERTYQGREDRELVLRLRKA